MKYIIGNRGCGVTTDIILEANRSGAAIITAFDASKDMYLKRAEELNIFPPKVYSLHDLDCRMTYGSKLSQEKIIFDNFDMIIKAIMRLKYNVDAEIEAIGTTLDNPYIGGKKNEPRL